MVRRFYPHEATLTLEEYRRLNPTRPVTDWPIGGATDGKRSADALASRIVTPDDSPIQAGWRKPRRDPPTLVPVRPSKPRKRPAGTQTTKKRENAT